MLQSTDDPTTHEATMDSAKIPAHEATTTTELAHEAVTMESAKLPAHEAATTTMESANILATMDSAVVNVSTPRIDAVCNAQ